MIGAVGGPETAIFFRPVDRAAAVGPEAAAQKREAGVVDSEGRPLSRDAGASELALSREKRSLLARLRGEKAALEQELLRAPSEDRTEAEAAAAADKRDGDSAALADLTEGEQAQLDELKARDREVRAHEQAHAAVGGRYAGSPSYEYQTGPDGRRYAIGGEVSIDVAPIPGDPQATIDKMRVVIDAALAPVEPSSADRSVAQAAQSLMQEAMAEARAGETAERLGAPPETAAAGYAQGRAATSAQAAPIFRLAA